MNQNLADHKIEFTIGFTPAQLQTINQVVLKHLPGYRATPDQHKLLAVPGRLASLQQYQPISDVFLLASRLMVCIGQAHAFSDANKRTALLAVLCYLLAQGIEMKPLPAAFSDHVVACILGELTEQHFARLLALYQKK